MSCFSDLVTVQATANSSYSLEKDAGFTLTVLNSLVGQDYNNGSDMAASKIDFALKRLIQDIEGHKDSKLETKSLLHNRRLGYPLEQRVSVPAGSGKKGIYIETNSRVFAKVHVSKISLFVETTGDYDVEVWDMVQNKQLDTITVSATANEVSTTFVDKTYQTDRADLHLAFLYDSTATGSIKTVIDPKACMSCGRKIFHRNAWVESYGITNTGASVTTSSINYANETGGLIVDYSLQCDHRSWLCSVKNLIAMPLFYLSAEQIAHYAIQNSTRLNSETMLRNWEDRQIFYQTEYNKALNDLMSKLTVPKDNPCFKCVRRFRTVTTH